MNKNFRCFLFFILFFLQLRALAGGGIGLIGNGGHGVVCSSSTSIGGSIQTTFLLDLVELKYAYGGRISLIPNNHKDYRLFSLKTKDVQANMKLFTMRLLQLGDDSEVRKIVELIKSPSIIFSYSIFSQRTNDFGYLYFDENICQLEQLAFYVKSKKTVELSLRYLTPQNISVEDFSALLLHEILHEYFFDYKKEYSTLPLRQLVGFLSADDLFRQKNRTKILTLIRSKKAQKLN